MVTGEPIPVRTKARQKVCMICDHDDAIISHHDMLHRSWDKLIIDIYGLYFKGKYGWGVTKYLSKVKLKFDADADAEYQEVDFLPSTPPLTQQSPTKKRKKKLYEQGYTLTPEQLDLMVKGKRIQKLVDDGVTTGEIINHRTFPDCPLSQEESVELTEEMQAADRKELAANMKAYNEVMSYTIAPEQVAEMKRRGVY
jgi:hypothetical protein